MSTPPTPFADRETLEKELKALERDLGDLRSLTNPSWLEHDIVNSYADSTTTGLYINLIHMYICFHDPLYHLVGTSDTEDSLSLSSLNTSIASNDSVFSRPGVGAGGNGQGGGVRGSNFTLAALRQLGIHLKPCATCIYLHFSYRGQLQMFVDRHTDERRTLDKVNVSWPISNPSLKVRTPGCSQMLSRVAKGCED